MNRELPRKVRKELEIAIGKLFGPLEETLKNQLEGLIRNCQERLSRDFENSTGFGDTKFLEGKPESAAPAGSMTTLHHNTDAACSVLAPYTVPMDSSFNIWNGLDVTSSSQTCDYPDSSYFSEMSHPLPSDPWWPSDFDGVRLLPSSDPPQMDVTNSVESQLVDLGEGSNLSGKSKGKGKAKA